MKLDGVYSILVTYSLNLVLNTGLFLLLFLVYSQYIRMTFLDRHPLSMEDSRQGFLPQQTR